MEIQFIKLARAIDVFYSIIMVFLTQVLAIYVEGLVLWLASTLFSHLFHTETLIKFFKGVMLSCKKKKVEKQFHNFYGASQLFQLSSNENRISSKNSFCSAPNFCFNILSTLCSINFPTFQLYKNFKLTVFDRRKGRRVAFNLYL